MSRPTLITFIGKSAKDPHDPVPKIALRMAEEVGRLIEIRAKYEGYIARQDKQIERSAQWETKLIPQAIDKIIQGELTPESGAQWLQEQTEALVKEQQ